MLNEKQPPQRSLNNYKNLTRSIAQSHARTEITKKKKHISTNLLTDFFNAQWVQWLKHYVKSRFGPRHKFVTYEGTTDKGIYQLHSNDNRSQIRIALAADWGTDTAESEHIGKAIGHHKPDYSIHLGDTYFVGAPFEIENNFSPDNSYWPYGSAGSFALTGNHEMYSNGNPYFEKLLPWMGLFQPQRIVQHASYFALENNFWRIIGLDTGYRSVGIPFLEYFLSKANLREEVVNWLIKDLKIEEDNRGLILLTHHQYVSAFDNKYPCAAEQLAKVIGKERKVLWFWGHEHRFALYGKNSQPKGITAYGRCIGHGGMPTSLVKKMNEKKIQESNLVLYDNRLNKTVDKTEVGHNGYAIMNIENENLTVDYYDEQKLLLTEKWQFNVDTRAIEGKEILSYNSELSEVKSIRQAIE